MMKFMKPETSNEDCDHYLTNKMTQSSGVSSSLSFLIKSFDDVNVIDVGAPARNNRCTTSESVKCMKLYG